LPGKVLQSQVIQNFKVFYAATEPPLSTASSGFSCNARLSTDSVPLCSPGLRFLRNQHHHLRNSYENTQTRATHGTRSTTASIGKIAETRRVKSLRIQEEKETLTKRYRELQGKPGSWKTAT